jgi:broad specificity phosphatase PhoE
MAVVVRGGGDRGARAAAGADGRRRRRLVALPFLAAVAAACASLPFFSVVPSAGARGLVQFPLKRPLLNTYHLLRAGSSLLEEQDVYSTNPLFLTNRDSALSPSGQKQVVGACGAMALSGRAPTVVRFSLAASCIDSADAVARELRLGRDRVVAEYTYLDPRAVGRWDMLGLSDVEPAVWALDADNAGPDGDGGRPPPNDDGTPHETLADAAVRLRQLVSVLETQYSGDTILLIFPDGTGPALLSAMMAGVPLNRVHELEFRSGELRMDVTAGSVLELWKSRQAGPEAESYRDALERGRKTLRELRSTAPEAIVSKKDEQIERDRLEVERGVEERRRAQLLKSETEDAARAERRSRMRAERRSSSPPSGAADPALLGIAAAAAAAALVAGAAMAAPSPSSSPPPASGGADGKAEAERSELAGGRRDSTGAIDARPVNGDRSGPTSLGPPPADGAPAGAAFPSLYPPPAAGPTPAAPSLTPLEAARRAMDEYMGRDDGADDWLRSVEGILRDEAENDLFDDDDDDDNSREDGGDAPGG